MCLKHSVEFDLADGQGVIEGARAGSWLAAISFGGVRMLMVMGDGDRGRTEWSK